MQKKLIPWNLIIANLKGEIDSHDKRVLEEWLSASDNKALYNELTVLWQSIKMELSDYNPDIESYWLELKKRLQTKKKHKRLQLYARAIVSVVAIMITITLTWIVSKHSEVYPDSVQTYTSFNGKSKVTLPDGSTVWLNKGSTIEYSSMFAKERCLSLDGEALFDVIKNNNKPFIIHAGDMQIKVYGTQFNVNSYSGNEQASVALIEGSISIIANNKETRLVPGEIATFNKTNQALLTKIIPPAPSITSNSAGGVGTQHKVIMGKTIEEELKFESFWANETLTFEGKDLGYICKYLEKWYKVKINLDTTLVKSQYYTFTLKDEPLEQILRNMNRINPISYSFLEERGVSIVNVKPQK